MDEKCGLVLNVPNVMPGWGCCKCKSYNGLQRQKCNWCGHECCYPDKPKPEDFGLCNECGVPLDGVGKMKTADGKILQHRGH
jgi:hypothetical protein